MSNPIIEEARTWLGTAFCHQGRSKKTSNHQGGCDCLGLIIGVAKKLQLKSRNGMCLGDFDRLDYQSTPPSELLVKSLEQHCRLLQYPRPGAIVLLSFLNNPQHLAIIATHHYNNSEELSIVHAYQTLGVVCEHRFDYKWQRRVVSFYSFGA